MGTQTTNESMSYTPFGSQATKRKNVPDTWQTYRIGDCLERVENPVEVDPEALYTQIGIRSHGKGLFYKEPVSGAELGNKSVFWIEPDCFILNIVFAWEQAIGRTTAAEAGMIGSHRFPMYRPVKDRVDIDYLIYYFLTKRGTDILEAASPGGAGRNRTLGQERFLKSRITLPPIEEQRRIAEILATQDRVIELYGRKIEQLQKFKKGALSKLFPKKGYNTPEVRFPGFTGLWKRRKIQEVFSFLQNNTLSRAECSMNSGFAKSIHYGDVLVKIGDCLDVTTAELPYIPSEHEVVKYKDSFLQSGDIVMADTAEDETVGKCTEITNLQKLTIIAGLHTIPMRPKVKVATGYFGHYLNSPAYHNQLLPLMQGIKVTSVSRSAIQNTTVSLPTDTKEQTVISQFFNAIDNSIHLHQRKRDEEIRKKKALMQLLLTGKVRVKS